MVDVVAITVSHCLSCFITRVATFVFNASVLSKRHPLPDGSEGLAWKYIRDCSERAPLVLALILHMRNQRGVSLDQFKYYNNTRLLSSEN